MHWPVHFIIKVLKCFSLHPNFGCFVLHASLITFRYRSLRGIIYNQFHNILRLVDVLPNFPIPQAKRCAIIAYKHGIYELPHQLLNDLRLRILEN